MRAELAQLTVTEENLFMYMNVTRLFNLKVIQDILLDTDPSDPFNNDQTRRYIQYMSLEQGFFGMFYHKTPREYIEGYTDPLLQTLSETPVYLAGDKTNSPILAINIDPLSPANNPIAFF